MKRVSGRYTRNNDEWYTRQETAEKIAGWLSRNLPLSSKILCPADILPDGSESEIPKALRKMGFANVRVTRDLPVSPIYSDYNEGEIVVTNPPFSMLKQFRDFMYANGVKFCVLSRPGAFGESYPVQELDSRFKDKDGHTVAACWMQNFVNTIKTGDAFDNSPIGNCALCERKHCTKNTLTVEWTPGVDRPLYGWCIAVKNGLSGFFCQEYITEGKQHFLRFYNPYDRKNGVETSIEKRLLERKSL